MDTSDHEISFDTDGICNHCHDYDRVVGRQYKPGEEGRRALDSLIETIRREGRGKPYDCVIGLSGGVDSTYAAYLAKQLGLRPLAVHLDNGWNSEIAVRNIENIVKKLGFDLETIVLDWEEFRHLQVAFLHASTPDSEIPTDHAIVAALYQTAVRHGVRWIVDGSNVVTEMMVPPVWSHGHYDWRYIRHINKRFGGLPLRTFPHFSFWGLRYYTHVKRIVQLRLLEYVPYNKLAAMEVMKTELGWEYYGAKHYESIYTRFFQGYILPVKFGFDKRRSHLSCLVNQGLITRDQALQEIAKPAIPPDQLVEDRAFVIKKLGLNEEAFEEIMQAERKTFWDYPSDEVAMLTELRWRPVLFLLDLARRVRSALRGSRDSRRAPTVGAEPRTVSAISARHEGGKN